MKTNIILICIIICTVVYSCNNQQSIKLDTDLDAIGKNIEIPDELQILVYNRVVEEFTTNYSDFKIITYIDSIGCTPCKMKLAAWSDFLNIVKSVNDISVDFIMIIRSKWTESIDKAIVNSHFLHPIC